MVQISNRILGVSMILFSMTIGIASGASAAGCSAQIVKDSDGAYAGCAVSMGNREYSMGKDAASENGCSQVCNIMAEVSGARGGLNQNISAAKLAR